MRTWIRDRYRTMEQCGISAVAYKQLQSRVTEYYGPSETEKLDMLSLACASGKIRLVTKDYKTLLESANQYDPSAILAEVCKLEGVPASDRVHDALALRIARVFGNDAADLYRVMGTDNLAATIQAIVDPDSSPILTHPAYFVHPRGNKQCANCEYTFTGAGRFCSSHCHYNFGGETCPHVLCEDCKL